jgi:glycosyltransferase involved in cell wall biosynthesis
MHLGDRAIEILHNPVDTELFYPSQGSVVKHRIVFAGSIVEKKGIRELCHSMKYILGKFPEAELIAAGRDCRAPDGSPSFRQQIEEQIGNETKRHIKFPGPLKQTDVSALMASAEVCIFPSYMETQGIVIAEAMSCGRPVLVSNKGPGPEVLGKDGECGWMVNPEDPEDIAEKTARVLSDRIRADEMGKKGRQRSETVFSVSACMEHNLAFYQGCSIGH